MQLCSYVCYVTTHLTVGMECSKEWKKMRDRYVKEKNKLKGRSGDEAKLLKKWPLYKYLTFLSDFVKCRRQAY